MVRQASDFPPFPLFYGSFGTTCCFIFFGQAADAANAEAEASAAWSWKLWEMGFAGVL